MQRTLKLYKLPEVRLSICLVYSVFDAQLFTVYDVWFLNAHRTGAASVVARVGVYFTGIFLECHPVVNLSHGVFHSWLKNLPCLQVSSSLISSLFSGLNIVTVCLEMFGNCNASKCCGLSQPIWLLINWNINVTMTQFLRWWTVKFSMLQVHFKDSFTVITPGKSGSAEYPIKNT